MHARFGRIKAIGPFKMEVLGLQGAEEAFDRRIVEAVVFLRMALGERVPNPDCLAKYAAAFFRMSRSSVTRLSSAAATPRFGVSASIVLAQAPHRP